MTNVLVALKNLLDNPRGIINIDRKREEMKMD